jgi:cation diffusion facilitator family transporter
MDPTVVGPAREGAPSPADASAGVFTAHEGRQARRLAMVIGIVAGFFVLELGGAIVAESVVLQADALHLLMDILALGVSLFAMRLAVRKPTPRFTYGLRRAEPVAAIFSGVLVLGTTVVIVAEGIEALHGALHGQAAPRAGVMLVVATMALVVHGVSAWLLHDAIGHHGPGHRPGPGHGLGGAGHEHGHGHDAEAHAHGHGHGHDVDLERDGHAHQRAGEADHVHDGEGDHHGDSRGHALNLRGAWLHLASDALGAVAALVAALVIHFGGNAAADPIASFLVAAILVVGAVGLLRDATLVLLEAAPPHMPLAAIREAIAGTSGVLAVRHLHVWTLGAGHDAVTVHVRTASADPAFGQRLSARIRGRFGAEYVTVQVETTAAAAEEP